VLLARADELEAQLRLSLGDQQTPAGLASGLPAPRRDLLLARIALAAGDHQAAQHRLQALPPEGFTPRRALERQILMAAAAIGRGDPAAAVIVGDVMHTARRDGFLNTVVTTAPQVTGYLIGHSHAPPDPFMEHVIAAALQVRDTQPAAPRSLADPLTQTELRILRLLPTTTTDQAAAALYISRNTVKTHLKSIYQKLGVASRSGAIQRAADLHLL
jgi:LuxR family transcriptional regulator, maltose regulon positive regulatory protein